MASDEWCSNPYHGDACPQPPKPTASAPAPKHEVGRCSECNGAFSHRDGCPRDGLRIDPVLCPICECCEIARGKCVGGCHPSARRDQRAVYVVVLPRPDVPDEVFLEIEDEYGRGVRVHSRLDGETRRIGPLYLLPAPVAAAGEGE